MPRKDKLLLICKPQLGILTDANKWCFYLRDQYDITVICFDTGKPKLEIPEVRVKYVSYAGSYRSRGKRFVVYALWNILWFRGKIMVVYFEHCDIFKKVFPFRRMLLDIRTLAVSPDKEQRKRENDAIIKACQKYDLISVISEGVRRFINLTQKKIDILPLGGDCISDAPKDFGKIHLLYVGTLYNRSIEKTIEGVALFRKNNPEMSIKYDIVGEGHSNEIECFKRLASQLDVSDVIAFHGHIANTLLKPFFNKANIGVSFVPLTPYYDHQPPTKTFEYILSGLYTIATATYCNKELITETNGVLIMDTPEDFVRGLEQFIAVHDLLDEASIRRSLQKSMWKNIVNNHLRPILKRL